MHSELHVLQCMYVQVSLRTCTKPLSLPLFDRLQYVNYVLVYPYCKQGEAKGAGMRLIRYGSRLQGSSQSYPTHGDLIVLSWKMIAYKWSTSTAKPVL